MYTKSLYEEFAQMILELEEKFNIFSANKTISKCKKLKIYVYLLIFY